MNFIDAAEEPISLYKSTRLSIFKTLTDNCTEEDSGQDEHATTITKSPQPMKKTALSKTSKEFIMPKNKTPIVAASVQQTKKGRRTAQKSSQPGY